MTQEEIINLVVNEYGFTLGSNTASSAVFTKHIADLDFEGNEEYLEAKYFTNMRSEVCFTIEKVKVTVKKDQWSWQVLSDASIRQSIEKNPAYALLANAEKITLESEKWINKNVERIMDL